MEKVKKKMLKKPIPSTSAKFMKEDKKSNLENEQYAAIPSTVIEDSETGARYNFATKHNFSSVNGGSYKM